MNMKRWRYLRILLVIICWMITFVCIDFLLDKIDIINYLKSIKLLQGIEQLQNIASNEWLKRIINKVFSFIIANIFAIISTFISCKKFNSEAMPRLHLIVINTTNIRRSKLRKTLPEILIGDGKYYIYVTIDIQNVGEGVIENCKINGQMLEIGQIDNTKGEEVYIRIATSNKNLSETYYDFMIEFDDALERNYKKKFGLLVDAEKQMSKIIVKKRQRRKYRK